MSYTPEIIDVSVSPAQIELRDAYASANQEVLNDLYLEESDSSWSEKVPEVIVVLCASRSGSSLIFNALSSSGRVIAPGGEHEPWLTLTQNKYPFQDSDTVHGDVSQKDLLLKLLRNDLLVRDRQLDTERALIPMRNRLVVRRQHDVEGFAGTMAQIALRKNLLHTEWEHVLDDLGSLAVKPMPITTKEFGDSQYGLPLENPPLIRQPLAHVASDDEIKDLPLLFKSPSDVHRAGYYEQLFPNAKINYIHLSRGYVQTANGLMDGWQMDDTDFISNPVGVVSPLAIEDYSITDMTRAYWCFDLFEGWKDYAQSTLIEVCTQQWLAAHTNIMQDFPVDNQLTFEDYYTDPENFYRKLSEITGIDTTGYDWMKSIMSTEPPSQMRWLKRSSLFRNLGAYLPGSVLKDVVELQDNLGYKMDEETWH